MKNNVIFLSDVIRKQIETNLISFSKEIEEMKKIPHSISDLHELEDTLQDFKDIIKSTTNHFALCGLNQLIKKELLILQKYINFIKKIYVKNK